MKQRPSFAAVFGLARSLLMYYAIPGRARGWRRFYSPFVKPGDLCFDIGAHVGNRTAALLALGAQVVAVEPQLLFAKTLQRLFGRKDKFTLLPKAVGEKMGQTQMLVSQRTPTLSTLSSEWAEEVSHTPGFASTDWDQHLDVEVTTLDALISEFGQPVFCKIDIEGYELRALRGLSKPIALISFEYIPAVMNRAQACVTRISQLGDYSFNLMKSEVPKLAFPNWVDKTEIIKLLRQIPPNGRAGEVYARLQGSSR